MPYPETLALIAAAQVGDLVARNAVITGNLRLVAAIAEKAAEAVGRSDLVDDLIMAGAMGIADGDGLLHAVMHFDPARGVRFATYAHAYIREAVSKQLASLSRDLGTYKSREKLTAIRRVATTLGTTLGRAATAVETHAELLRRGRKGVALGRVEYALQRPGRETHVEASAGSEDEVIAGIDRRRMLGAIQEAAFAALSSDEQALLIDRFSNGAKLTGAERKAADAAEAKLRAAVAADGR